MSNRIEDKVKSKIKRLIFLTICERLYHFVVYTLCKKYVKKINSIRHSRQVLIQRFRFLRKKISIR